MQTAEIKTLKFQEAFSGYRFVRDCEGRCLRMEG